MAAKSYAVWKLRDYMYKINVHVSIMSTYEASRLRYFIIIVDQCSVT